MATLDKQNQHVVTRITNRLQEIILAALEKKGVRIRAWDASIDNVLPKNWKSVRFILWPEELADSDAQRDEKHLLPAALALADAMAECGNNLVTFNPEFRAQPCVTGGFRHVAEGPLTVRGLYWMGMPEPDFMPRMYFQVDVIYDRAQ